MGNKQTFCRFCHYLERLTKDTFGNKLNLRKSLDTVLRVNQGRINSLNSFANVILYCCNITIITYPFLIVNCIAFF